MGVVFALISAVVWGSGDFCGGLAARRHSPFQVLLYVSLSGLAVVVLIAALLGETFPSYPNLLWAVIAGVSGALGLAALYRGLSIGSAATVAPTSSVIGALLPVGYGLLVAGMPPLNRMIGFFLALLGIWLVARSASQDTPHARRGLLLGCLAGVGFGGFFILVGQIETGKVFTPLVITRCVMLGMAILLLRANRLPLPGWRANPLAWLAGVLDAGGNIFYLLAKQYTRLDIAAVLSSLYPMFTVLLSSLILKEHVSRSQWLGVITCLLAVIMITI